MTGVCFLDNYDFDGTVKCNVLTSRVKAIVRKPVVATGNLVNVFLSELDDFSHAEPLPSKRQRLDGIRPSLQSNMHANECLLRCTPCACLYDKSSWLRHN
jgi:hypothetical protein